MTGWSICPAMLPALVTTLPAIDPTDSATLPAALAEVVAVSTRLVTALFRRYQITSLLTAFDRRGLLRASTAGLNSGSFGCNGIDDALEQVTGASSREDQLGIGRVVFEFGAKP